MFLSTNPEVDGQNLLNNGSFELANPSVIFTSPYNTYPISGSYVTASSPYVLWFHTYRTGYPQFGFGGFSTGAPYNYHGYQWPRTGNAYCVVGEYCFVPVFPLQKPMSAGQCYRISYFVSRCDLESCAMDAIDGYFSKDSIHPLMLTPDTVVPQIINPLGVIYDTMQWTRISGEYIASGTERYFAVGNFYGVLRKGQRTKVCPDSIIYNYGGLDAISASMLRDDFVAGYYLDDVAIWECGTPEYPADAGPDLKICLGEEAEIGAMEARDEYLYLWSERSWHGPRHLWDTLATTPKLTVNPKKTTTYYLWSIDFKFEHTYDSVTVFVENCNIDLEIPNVFTPNGDGFNDYFMISNPKQMNYTLDIFNRWGNMVFQGNQNYYWSGTFNNEPAPAGAYFYVLKATTPDGTLSKEFHGSVTILR